MNRLILSLLLAGGLSASSASASAPVYYGFAPTDCTVDNLNSLGTGNNSFIEAAIRVDAASDPLVADLKGKKVTGVRCFLRSDYKQKSKGFSCIKIYTDGLESTPVTKTVNFLAGWNEVLFDTPIEIGDKPLYVSYQVFETQGAPFPLASYKNAALPQEMCYIRAAKGKWEEYGHRGAIAMEAIVDADSSIADGHVIASPFDLPLAVVPGKEFNCSMYVHNQGATPIESIRYECLDGSGNAIGAATLEFAAPVGAYCSTVANVKLTAPDTEGSGIPLAVSTVEINGNQAKDCMKSSVRLYISADVFNRIPLVEEFTGITCTNCPFMFYYLDKALEEFGAPHVYVSHHAGYQNDKLTQPCDEALLYLFGPRSSFNPAAMYDRRVAIGDNSPIQGAKEPSTEPYLARLNNIMEYPALAKVLVDSNIDENKATCTVHGKIGKAAMDFKDELYLTVYLIENDIPNIKYPQLGLLPVPEGAPEDLLERFRHTGVIRHDFCGGSNGAPLAVNADGTYSVDFALDKIDSDWTLDNCEIVAFVHKVNTEDMTDNYVLNAGATRYNDFAESSVKSVVADSDLRIFVRGDGQICCSDPLARLDVYTLAGIRCDAATRLPAGLYIVRATDATGHSAAKRVLIR